MGPSKSVIKLRQNVTTSYSKHKMRLLKDSSNAGVTKTEVGLDDSYPEETNTENILTQL